MPTRVSAVVDRCYLTLAAARIGESVLLASAGLTLTFAAIVAEGGALATVDAWIVGLVCALLTGIGWNLEHARGRYDVARELDERLRHQGALVTAYELERGGDRSPMAELLARRVLARLRTGEALRSLFPPLAIPVAVPVLGAGLLALALDARRDAVPAPVDLAPLTAGLLEAVEALEMGAVEGSNSEGGIDNASRKEVMRLARRTRDLKSRSAELRDDPERAERELRELDAELAAAAPRVARDPDLKRSLEEARNWIDAARMAVARDADGGERASGAAGDREDGGDAMTAGSEDGTMVGQNSRDATGDTAPTEAGLESVAPDGEPGGTGPSDSGTIAGTTWAPAYDGIVSAWSRRARARANPNE